MQPTNTFDSMRKSTQATDYSKVFGTQNMQKPNRNVYSGSWDIKDSVEINSKPKMSKTKKILLGLGATAIAVTAALLVKGGNKGDYIERAQKTFQETFMRNDISREETVNLLNEYKEILKINDKDNFVNAMFENAKKNFGLSHLNFHMEKVDLPKSKIASMGPDGKFTVNKNLDFEKDDFINIIFHEFRHAKQNELMCSKDTKRYLSGIYTRSKDVVKQKDSAYCEKLREIAKNQSGNTLSKQQIEELVDASLEHKWTAILKKQLVDKLGLGKLKVPEELSEYIEKCFVAHKNYNEVNPIKYYFNFLEKDARKSGEGMRKILKSIPDKLE